MAEEPERVSTLDGGWGRIVWDLHRALRAAKLDPLARSLFDEAMELSWRVASMEKDEARPFRLNHSDLARFLESDRKNIRSAHARLIAMNIFTVTDDGEVINKDYRTWKTMEGGPLLSPSQIERAVNIRKTPSANTPGKGRRGGVIRPGVIPIGDSSPLQPLARTPQGGGGLTTPPLSASTPHPPGVPPDPHIGSGRAEELIQELREKEEQHSTREDAGDFTLPDQDLSPIHQGPYSPTTDQVIATHKLALKAFPGTRIPEDIFSNQRMVSPECWQAAIREAVRAQPNGVDSFKYVLTIASKYEAHGIPIPKPIASEAPRRESKRDRDAAKFEALKDGLKDWYGKDCFDAS